MSDMILSNAYNNSTNESIIMNINTELIQSKQSNSNAIAFGDPQHNINQQHEHHHYTTYPEYSFHSIVPIEFTQMHPDYHFHQSAIDYRNDLSTTNYNNKAPKSPESISSSLSSPLSSSSINTKHILTNSQQVIDTELANVNGQFIPLNDNKFNNPTSVRVKEIIDRANSVPMEFYHTEFLEYSKETYEKKKDRKRKRSNNQQQEINKRKKFNILPANDSDYDTDEDGFENDGQNHNAEVRRQIHIQSEQKRRAQIKNGFDELRKHLPGCNNKKMSKATLLTRTVQQIQHLKHMQNDLLSEVERLLQENESLKKFQHGVLDGQTMEKIYTY